MTKVTLHWNVEIDLSLGVKIQVLHIPNEKNQNQCSSVWGFWQILYWLERNCYLKCQRDWFTVSLNYYTANSKSKLGVHGQRDRIKIILTECPCVNGYIEITT